MTRVAKLVIVDPDDQYLVLYRSNHPVFGDDPDIPGGVVEDHESMVEAMVREVREEAGIELIGDDVMEIFSGSHRDDGVIDHALYMVRFDQRPEVATSWEHMGYEWVNRDDFLAKSRSANDTFMHFVHEKVADLSSR